MSDDVAIHVKGLGKKYTIGGPQEKYLTLRDALANSVKKPFQWMNRQGASQSTNEFWALKDVSFDVYEGEVVGIIGRNGAGKSTLLKILSQITTPTEGEVDIYGRVGSLLEVGTGFHPELTGRENIFLSGSILGMRKREIEEKFDEIVKFAEIEKFLDTPVKRYSSGMYVRLAFAVAAHMDTEILLVDEVLAVGDAAFQKKCMGKMGDAAAKEGRTVLFVSHNMAAVTGLCKKAILFDNGKIISNASTDKVIQEYHQSIQKNTIYDAPDIIFPINAGISAQIERVRFINSRGELSLSHDS
ncbi:MAG: ABC transporter ATP-binding protein, partial [Methanomicrobiales archaeon]